jgi:hypothetical protein
VLAIFFFFKYTRRGRIMLDRIGRPGEYDDEQAFAREEEAALESMDDLSRSEYLRAKGNTKYTASQTSSANIRVQLGSSQILQSPCKPISRCRSSSPSKKRVSLPGSSSPS